MDPDRWYAFEAGRQLGPMSWIALKARADSGLLRREDFVWREGLPDWLPASGVDGLLELRPPPLLESTPTIAPAVSAGEAVLATDAPALVFAGFWRRVAAYWIDTAIFWAAMLCFAVVLGAILALLGSKSSALPGLNTFMVIVYWLYFAGQESSSRRATLGKRVLGIQVVDLQGRRIDFARASGRHFGKFVSAILLCTGFLMAAFTTRKQALHDVMASCLVVIGRSSRPAIPDHEAWAKRHWGEARSRSSDGA
jgi:uncharacterized RDD family membrane protein YckC